MLFIWPQLAGSIEQSAMKNVKLGIKSVQKRVKQESQILVLFMSGTLFGVLGRFLNVKFSFRITNTNKEYASF